MIKQPIPKNELDRILKLSEYDIDFSDLKDSFRDLVKLAAKVAGTPMSLVSLIDAYTLWTISYHGLETDQTPREETVCQYTIMEPEHFEVEDLARDPRFKDEGFVTGEPHLRYYYGVPLKSEGLNIGSLCVMDQTDRNEKALPPEKVEMLKIIAEEIINRLKTYRHIESLRNKIVEEKSNQNKVMHDIRGPISGIMGLAQLISEQGEKNDINEVLEFINLIYKGGKSILELADEILSSDKKKSHLKNSELNLVSFKEKLEKLYFPQARSKNVLLVINTSRENEEVPFSQNKLLQIAGNLISNAIKFTPKFGDVSVDLNLSIIDEPHTLKISVKDTGVGIDEATIQKIIQDATSSTAGTEGEKGYGFGLELVKHLVHGLKGTLNVTSVISKGTVFEVLLPV